MQNNNKSSYIIFFFCNLYKKNDTWGGGHFSSFFVQIVIPLQINSLELYDKKYKCKVNISSNLHIDEEKREKSNFVQLCKKNGLLCGKYTKDSTFTLLQPQFNHIVTLTLMVRNVKHPFNLGEDEFTIIDP